MTNFDLSSLWPSFSSLFNGEIYTSQGLAALFVSITWFAFFLFLGISGYELWKSSKRYRFYRELIKGKNTSELSSSRRELLNNARENEQKNKWPELWNEFDETLVEIKLSAGKGLRNTSEASVFFNSSTLAGGLVGNRLLAAGSGIITGLGVLGTFVGLQLGLGSLVFDNGTDTLMQGIQQLVGSASIAFTTSVWGVLLSLLYNFLEKLFERRARTQITSLQTQIDGLFQRFSPSEILRDIKDDGHESRIVLQGLAERIGNSMQEAVTSMSGSIQQGMADSLHDVLVPALDRFATASEAMNDRQAHGSEDALRKLIEKFIENVGNEGDRQRDALSGASNDLTGALQEMSGKLNDFLKNLEKQQVGLREEQEGRMKILEKISKGQTETTGSLIKQGQSLGTSAQQTNQAMDKITKNMEKITQELEKTSGHLENTSGTLGTSVVDASERVRQSSSIADKLINENNRVEKNINQVMKLLENIQQGIEHSTEQLNQAADTAKEGYTKVSKNYLDLQDSLKEHVGQLEKQVAKLLRDYGEMVNNQTRERMGQWDKLTLQYTENMTQAISTIADVVEEIDVKIQPN